MLLTNIIRAIVKKNIELKTKLEKANSLQTPFQYIYQTIMMTSMSVITILIFNYLIFKSNPIKMIIIGIGILFISPFLYYFWISLVDVQIQKYSRQISGDMLFICEFLLVSLESGLPLGNSIQRISKLNRPGGKFFLRIYTDFKTGSNLEKALNNASIYSPNTEMKNLLKRLEDSLNIGVDLKQILENFITESEERKIIEIKGFSKKLNPIIMMYLLLGVVIPSLGVTFFMVGATLMAITPEMLKFILIFIFLIMFAFQYFAYSMFKFSKSTL